MMEFAIKKIYIVQFTKMENAKNAVMGISLLQSIAVLQKSLDVFIQTIFARLVQFRLILSTILAQLMVVFHISNKDVKLAKQVLLFQTIYVLSLIVTLLKI